MKIISSSGTIFYKRIFPTIWFGLLVIFAITMLSTGTLLKEPWIILHPIFMAALGYGVMNKFVWDLVDQVQDAGDHLIIRNGDREILVRFPEIISVDDVLWQSPQRVTLKLAQPSGFGSVIAFMPSLDSTSFRLLSSCAIAESLRKRMKAARTVDPVTLPPTA